MVVGAGVYQVQGNSGGGMHAFNLHGLDCMIYLVMQTDID